MTSRVCLDADADADADARREIEKAAKRTFGLSLSEAACLGQVILTGG